MPLIGIQQTPSTFKPNSNTSQYIMRVVPSAVPQAYQLALAQFVDATVDASFKVKQPDAHEKIAAEKVKEHWKSKLPKLLTSETSRDHLICRDFHPENTDGNIISTPGNLWQACRRCNDTIRQGATLLDFLSGRYRLGQDNQLVTYTATTNHPSQLAALQSQPGFLQGSAFPYGFQLFQRSRPFLAPPKDHWHSLRDFLSRTASMPPGARTETQRDVAGSPPPTTNGLSWNTRIAIASGPYNILPVTSNVSTAPSSKFWASPQDVPTTLTRPVGDNPIAQLSQLFRVLMTCPTQWALWRQELPKLQQAWHGLAEATVFSEGLQNALRHPSVTGDKLHWVFVPGKDGPYIRSSV
jgi:hypothetical protein